MSKDKSIDGEFRVITVLSRLGYYIAIPIGDFAPYDLIAIKNDKMFKIQVKSTTKNNLVIKRGCERMNGYSRDDVDYFVIIDYDGNCYSLPYDLVGDKPKGFTLSKLAKYKIGDTYEF